MQIRIKKVGYLLSMAIFLLSSNIQIRASESEGIKNDFQTEDENDLQKAFEDMNSEEFGDFIIQNDKNIYGDEGSIEKRVVIYDAEKNIVPESLILYDALTKISIPLAKASGYYACFSKVEWISRGGVWSLSVTPHFAANGYSKDQAWAFLKSAHVGNSQWNHKNVNSMYNQFVCHYDWAGSFKTPWNLEPSTSDKGYWGFVANACN